MRADMLEIGAYQGRTAILLQYLCRENEQLAVCDIFDKPLPHQRPCWSGRYGIG